ncbi:MAG: ROK family protein [Saprospiraceae bacterium]|nr:ROK family protein [Bacteroidia bacterium]NNE15408.1 ROK family protein [Saprospiraceae bacterium]NNL92264.1 ROK family protein [Saprospiraceae bacterium]
MSNQFLWGIDLGGTKIEAVVLDVNKQYEIVERRRIQTDAHLGYESVIENIYIFLNQMSKDLGIPLTHLGIGTPGSINPYTSKLRNCNSVYLNGHPFRDDLEQKLKIPVRMTNDANCFAISEYKMGVVHDILPDAQCVFGLIMGTGVGSGIVVNGKILEGKNGIGGEWGHNFLDKSGGKCYCGKIGCVETVLSGPALQKFYLKSSGNSKSLKEIVAAYREGSDVHATATMERLFNFFPLAISTIINVIDPEVIVMGGGLGNIDEIYTEGIKRLPEFVFSDYIETQFVKPKYGDSSGVLGAALLWS